MMIDGTKSLFNRTCFSFQKMPLNLEFLRDRNHNGSKFAEIAVDLMNPVIAGHADSWRTATGKALCGVELRWHVGLSRKRST
jgi:hypothetical protein